MGTIRKQGIQNAIINYTGIAIGFINLIVLQPLFLSPEEIGLTRLLFYFSSLVAVFLPLGINHITIRFFPVFRNEANKHHGYFGFMLLFPLAGFLICSLFLWMTAPFFMNQYQTESPLFSEYFEWVLPLSFFLGLINVLGVYAASIFKTAFPSFLNDVLSRILTMAVISAYYLDWISLDVFVGFFVGVSGLQVLLLFIYALKLEETSFQYNKEKFSKDKVMEMAGYGGIVSLAAISGLGLKMLDTLVLGKYLPLSFVGIYSIAAFIPTLIEAPLNALERITASKIAHATVANKKDEIKTIYYQSSRYLFLLGGILFLGININTDSLFTFLPPGFESGKPVVGIISLAALVNMAGGSNGYIMLSSDKYKLAAGMLISVAVLSFILSVWWIPLFGMNGAASAMTISVCVLGISRFLLIKSKFGLQPYDGKSVRIAILIFACLITNGFIPAMDQPITDFFIRSTIITALYAAGAHGLKIAPELYRNFFAKN